MSRNTDGLEMTTFTALAGLGFLLLTQLSYSARIGRTFTTTHVCTLAFMVALSLITWLGHGWARWPLAGAYAFAGLLHGATVVEAIANRHQAHFSTAWLLQLAVFAFMFALTAATLVGSRQIRQFTNREAGTSAEPPQNEQ